MGTPVVDMKEVPGGLFTPEHWQRICLDLLQVAMDAYPYPCWQTKVKPQTKQWAMEHMEYENRKLKLAKERALAKLTYDDKVILGLPTL